MMKKSLLAIIMASLMLVTIFSAITVSAGYREYVVMGPVETVEPFNPNPTGVDGPDFIIDILKSSYNSQMGEYVLVEVSISNIGTPVEDGILVDVKLTLDSNEETVTFPYLGIGPCESKEVLMQYDEGPSPHTLTAIVDPDNEIPEDPDGGEDNNVKSINVKSKSSNLVLSNVLIKTLR